MKKTFLKITLLLVFSLSLSIVYSQEKPADLKKKLTECTEENQSLYENNKQLRAWMLGLRDSLKNQEATINKIEASSRTNCNAIQKNLDTKTNELKASQKTIEELKYELSIVQDANIARVYEFSIAEVRNSLLSRSSIDSLGFQVNEVLGGNAIKVSKEFDATIDSWRLSDKWTDVKLEMNLEVKPHQFNANKTLLLVSTIAQGKGKNIKQYQLIEDEAKIKLFQEKMLRILEANIRKQSKK
jgi:vacuolar-type H+-ATPase subunit I/STV1